MTTADEVRQAHASATSMRRSMRRPSVPSIVQLLAIRNIATAPTCISIPAWVVDETINLFGGHDVGVSFAEV
jgi:hypothetical protein